MAKMVCKKVGKMVKAYELGAGSEMEKKMLDEGKIVIREDGKYELFSQEAKSGSGEIAEAGFMFKIDGKGFPYPNDPEWFHANHRHVAGDEYEQLPKPLEAWEKDDEMSDAVKFLIDTGKLTLDWASVDAFMGAMLWGSWLTAGEDAVLIFYSVDRDEEGTVIGADFNFVARAEFDGENGYVYC